MEYLENDLKKIQKISFDYALYRTGDIDAANDISSQTTSLFLLSEKKTDNVKRWVINTSKNYCSKYFDNIKREKKYNRKYRSEILEFLAEPTNLESNDSLNQAFLDSFNSLNDQELNLIQYFFQSDQNIKLLHEKIGGSYPTLRKQISRLKNKLKAKTLRKLGYIGTKMIVTPQLNEVIIKFLQRFKTNLENNTLEKMHYYFSEIDINNYKKTFRIKKIFKYDINIIDSHYKAWVFFKKFDDELDSFYIEFYVDDNNHLKILTPPTKVKGVAIIEPLSEEGKKISELLNKYPINKTGRPDIPIDEIESILKQLEKKREDQSKK